MKKVFVGTNRTNHFIYFRFDGLEHGATPLNAETFRAMIHGK